MKDGKAIRPETAERLVRNMEMAVQHIVASPYVERYAIGLTGNPETRFETYRAQGARKKDPISSFALLTWGMSRELALYVEKGLYDFIKNADARSDVRKAHKRFLGPYRPSANRKFSEHFLYLCW